MMAHLEEENMMYVALLRHHARLVETQRLTKIKTPAGKRNDVQRYSNDLKSGPSGFQMVIFRTLFGPVFEELKCLR
jgi:hypothetical protein